MVDAAGNRTGGVNFSTVDPNPRLRPSQTARRLRLLAVAFCGRSSSLNFVLLQREPEHATIEQVCLIPAYLIDGNRVIPEKRLCCDQI